MLQIKKLKNKIKIEYLFLFIGIIWGIIQVFHSAPFGIATEKTDFYRAWSITEGHLYCKDGPYLEANNDLKELISKFSHYRYDYIAENNLNFSSEKAYLLEKEFNSDKRRVYVPSCNYNPISHIPSSAGISIARLLNLSFLQGMYAGRLTNLFIALLFVFLAIRIVPYGKLIFLLSALLPKTMLLFSSLSGDAFHISAIFLFIAIILFYLQKAKLGKGDLIIIFISSLFLTQIKPGYFFILLLLLLLRPKQFENKTKQCLFIIVTLFSNAILLWGLTRISGVPHGLDISTNLINPLEIYFYEHANFILHHPLKYLEIIPNTFALNWAPYLKQITGLDQHTMISWSGVFIAIVSVALYCIISRSKQKEKFCYYLPNKYLLLLTFLSIIICVFTLLYFSWTDPEDNAILSFDGRYFIPILPLLFYAFYGLKRKTLGKGGAPCSDSE